METFYNTLCMLLTSDLKIEFMLHICFEVGRMQLIPGERWKGIGDRPDGGKRTNSNVSVVMACRELV